MPAPPRGEGGEKHRRIGGRAVAVQVVIHAKPGHGRRVVVHIRSGSRSRESPAPGPGCTEESSCTSTEAPQATVHVRGCVVSGTSTTEGRHWRCKPLATRGGMQHSERSCDPGIPPLARHQRLGESGESTLPCAQRGRLSALHSHLPWSTDRPAVPNVSWGKRVLYPPVNATVTNAPPEIAA